MYQHLDHVALDLFAPTVDSLLQLAAREDRSGPCQQGVQQGELARRQSARGVAETTFVGGRVEFEASVAHQGRGAAPLAAQRRTHAGQQFRDFERLDQIIVGAEVEAANAFFERVARADDQHRQVLAPPAQIAQQLGAVAPGQAQIEQHQVVGRGRERRCGLSRIDGPVDRVRGVPQRLFQGRADHSIVFDQQDPHQSFSS